MIRIFLFDQRLPCIIEPIRFGEAEAKRIENINNPKRKLESLCALAALDELIRISHISYPLEILREENGKPYFKNSDISFSLSHSGDISVAAICDEKDNIVGVDVEKIIDRGNIDELAERFFSNAEKLDFLEHGKTPKAFFEIWTKKEAYAKMTGDGLSILIKEHSRSSKNIDSVYFEYYNILKEYSLSICSIRKADNVEFYNNFAGAKIQQQQ